MTGARKEASYNGALSAARRDKKAWGREGVAMSYTKLFLFGLTFLLSSWQTSLIKGILHQQIDLLQTSYFGYKQGGVWVIWLRGP